LGKIGSGKNRRRATQRRGDIIILQGRELVQKRAKKLTKNLDEIMAVGGDQARKIMIGGREAWGSAGRTERSQAEMVAGKGLKFRLKKMVA